MNFLMKAMIKRQMKNVPAEQQEKIIAAFEKDPNFFQEIAKQIQQKVKEGKDQQTASMVVMMANQQRLAELLK